MYNLFTTTYYQLSKKQVESIKVPDDLHTTVQLRAFEELLSLKKSKLFSTKPTGIKIDYPEFMFAMIAAYLPTREGYDLRRVAGDVVFRHDKDGCTYKNGVLHSYDDQPALVTEKEKIWYLNGERHRDCDLPAVIEKDGTKQWWRYGKLHRDDGKAAIIYTDYDESLWYKNGVLHRDYDLPAAIYLGGTEGWYKNGKKHRDGDLPAYVEGESYKQWYKDDQLHRDGDLPAVIMTRDADINRPVVIDRQREKETNLPLLRYTAYQIWYKKGKIHRDGDLPAYVDFDRKFWYKNGVLHREGDKPAVIEADLKEWWKNGKKIR